MLKHLTDGVAAAMVGAIVVGCSLLTALVVRLTTLDGVDDVVRDNKTTLKMAQVCRNTNAWVAAIFLSLLYFLVRHSTYLTLKAQILPEWYIL